MGTRRNTRSTDAIREKIQTAKLVEFLETHVISGTEVKKTQVSAAVALLRKTIPDLQSIEGSMDLHHHKHEQALGELE
jgi:hypothetical protein